MKMQLDADVAGSVLLRGLAAQFRCSPVRLFVAVAFTLFVVALAARPGLLGGGFGRGIAALEHADRPLLWIAGVGFGVSLVASAATWRTTLRACGARLGLPDACARYGVGSLINTLAPFRLGDAARVVLFARTLRQESGRMLTTGGALGAVSLARALVQTILVVVAVGVGTLPLLPFAVLAGVVSGGLLLALFFRRWLPRQRVEHLLDAFRGLARSPRHAARLFGWTAIAAAARVFAATAIASSLGVPWSLGTGLIITVALDLAGTIPLTPGNLGITSAAVALALHARAVPLTTAVAAGLAFHAVEIAAGLAFGSAGALLLAHSSSPSARRWSLGLAIALAGLLVAAGVDTVLLPSLI